jgi:type I restriction enzyme S subunit
VSARELITEHLDLWTGAVTQKSTRGRGSNSKVELTGIKKLREFVLELALRGKLTEQQLTDEPAETFLERIKTEQEAIGQRSGARTKSAIPSVDTQPFAIPQGWSWERLGNIGIVASSRRVRQRDWQDRGVPFYRAREIVKLSQQGHVNNELFISEDLFSELALSGHVPEVNDLMLTGVGTIGVPYIVEQDDRFYFKDASVLIFKNIFGLFPQFLYYFCHSEFWKKSIHEYSMGTTVHTLTIVRANHALIPVPPIEEQHRIVQKVDELMALCDRLEQQTSDQLEAHESLVDTLLGTLTQSENATELADNWARLATHFDNLFTTEQSIDKLKQTVLQLAVMGRLVVQDAENEPASLLLARIAEEKARLAKEGKIKAPKKLAEVEAGDIDRKPDGWEIVRFGDLVNIRSELVKALDYPDLDQVAPDSIEKGTGKLLFRRTVKESGAKGPNNKFQRGQILYSKIRPSLSKAVIAEFDGLCSADMYPINSFINLRYLLLAILSEPFLSQVRAVENRIKMPKLNIESLSNIVISLPPEAEQYRIVQEVDELMTLCDQLQGSLSQASETRRQLAQTVVKQAIS